MTTIPTTIPDGLTTEDTGYPHPVYGLDCTPDYIAGVMRRMAQRRGIARDTAYLSRRAVPATTAPIRATKTPTRTPKSCVECGESFVPTNSQQRYCTPLCQQRAARKRNPPKPRAPRRRGTVTAICVQCGGEFEATNRGKATRITCSNECRAMRQAETMRKWRAAL